MMKLGRNLQDTLGKAPTVLDLFAGAGGLTLGFHQAGFRSVAAIDMDQEAGRTLESNFEKLGTEVIISNLENFGPHALESLLKSSGKAAKFDVIVGGPPCQGWSQVGRGKLRSLHSQLADFDPRNELYKTFLKFVSKFQPSVAVMENVPGMLSHRGKNIANEVASGLEQTGYQVTWSLINAADFGVPQQRVRLFFVGVRNNLNYKFEFPRPSRNVVTVKEAIGDLPIIRNGAREWTRAYSKPKELSWFAKNMRKGAQPFIVLDHVCRNQNEQDLEAFRIMKQGQLYRDLPRRLKRYRDDIFEDKYKRLYWDRPSWCVTAHLSKDCYTHIHPSQTRTISVREAARLQSFPDSFQFTGGMGSKFRLIGNAVPPLVAKEIASSIRRQLFT